MDYISWKREIDADIETLQLLIAMVEDITPEYDFKLRELTRVIREKVAAPINPGNKKILIFTAFADTAECLYENISRMAQAELGLHTALITGSVDGRTTIPRFKADMNSGVSIMDLGLNEFRMNLLAYRKEHGDIEHTPFGIHAAVKGEKPGVIFILKNVNEDINIERQNRLHPFYMVYVGMDGEVITNHLQPKDTLDVMRHLARGRSAPDKDLCGRFNRATDNGRNMGKVSPGCWRTPSCLSLTPRTRETLTAFSPAARPRSSDDNEQKNLVAVCNEVFGADNYVTTIVWQKTLTRRNDAKKISSAHDYLLVYAKKQDYLKIEAEEVGDKQRNTYSNRDNDPRGDWLAIPFHAPNIRPNLTYPIITPSGREVYPPVGRCWSMTRDKYEELLADNRIYFGRNGDGMPQRKKFWEERGESEGVVPWTWWSYDFAGENREATKEQKDIFDDVTLFNGPKPTKLIRKFFH